MSKPSTLFISAGEPSGDTHGAHLLEALREAAPELTARGFGGRFLAGAGLDVLEDLPSQAVMGLFPVIKSLPRIRDWFARALESLDHAPPDAVILVDYPGFNLRLAAAAKKRGIPVIYYISPQVWAWNRRRVRRIAQVVDLMCVILPFEETFYAGSGVPTFYGGHPLVDHLEATPPNPRVLAGLRHMGGAPLVGIFPGSRMHVVDALMPVFVRTAAQLMKRPGMGETRFVFAAADEELALMIQAYPGIRDLPHQVVTRHPYEVMRAADMILTTSGTTTLEVAFHETPMVIAYRVSPILHAIGRMVVKVPHIGLANLVAGEEVVPEHVGSRLAPRALADDLERFWTDASARAACVEGLRRVRMSLSEPGSYRRTAARILEELGRRAPPLSE